MQEEVDEYLQDKNTEEFADILEAIYAVAAQLNTSPQELEALRAQKEQERGAFRDQIFLVSVTDAPES